MCVHPNFTHDLLMIVLQFFINDSSSLNFLNLLNSQHHNIKFTMESAVQCISFLDVCIKVNNNNSET